jgi:Tol biopolymer transport system component
MAATFDAEAMELTSPPTVIEEGVVSIGPYPLYSVSESGELLYQSGQGADAPDAMVWVTREGIAREIDPEWSEDFSALRLSPEGAMLAVTIREEGLGGDIWIKQLDQGPLSKLTFEPNSFDPSWKPDGASVTFVSDRAGTADIYVKRADGSAPAELILDHERPISQPVWSPDGTWLVFTLTGGQSDLYGFQPDTNSEPVPLVADDQINESWPAISPDGRWLAYVSRETGEEQVYVRPFPNVTDARWLVSTDGGVQPRWSSSGQELFYRGATPEMVAVDILPGSTFISGEHRVLFEWGDLDAIRWDVAPGDQRFVFVRSRRSEDSTNRLILVANFFEELKRLVPN